MKITIDTKDDSAEDIKRVVKMLQAWTDGHSNQPFNLFSDDSSSSSGSSSSASESTPVNEGLFNLFNDDKPDDKDDSEPETINLDNDSGDTPTIITY